MAEECKGGAGAASLCSQVEYYMSDDNLKADRFFYDELKKNKDGWIRSALLLRCNKVKKQTSKMQDVIAAIRASDKLEASPDGARFRRKEAFDMEKYPYPALSHNKALVKVEGLGAEVEWQAVKAALTEFGKIAFVRMFADTTAEGKKGYAYVAAFCNGKPEEEVVAAFTGASAKVDGADVTITAVSKDDADAFWAKEGEAGKKTQKRKRDRDSKAGGGGGAGGKGAKRPTYGPVTLGTEEFKTTAELRARVHNILHDSEMGSTLNERDTTLVKALMENHPNAEDKKKGLKSLEVSARKEYPDTRCFFVVREDGSKEDFSWVRCATAVEEGLKDKESVAKKARAEEPKGAAIAAPVTAAAAPLKYAGAE